MTSWKDWKYCSYIRPCFVYCLKPCFSSLGDEYGFKDCKHLDFSHCNLKEVPDEIFSLERTLEELLLDVNSIRDLPRVIFHCTGLKKLSISDNEIETLPNAISSLIYLEYLNLSRNSLLVIPDGIKCCKCLIVLDCSVNPLGKVPDSLTQLINLQELYLNDTFLEYLPANFGRLSKLRIVELRENNLKILPKSFQRLINLERLDIGQNELVDFPEVLCNLINLQELWIDGNRISSLPEIIGNLTKLTYLDASENRIITVATRISSCHKLTDLLLSGNKIVELPETLGSLKYLSYLRLDDNKLTSLPQSIGGLSSLQELVISNNYIQSIPKNIGFLRALHSLIMDCNSVKELPDNICSCTKLRLLSIASNELSELPEEIGRLNNLRVLNLRNNLLKFLPYSFASIKNLQTLWLSDNQQKPIMKLQADTDEATNKKILTCFLLPQQSSMNFEEAYVSDHDDDDPSSLSKSDGRSNNSESRIKFYSINGELDNDEQFISKLVRNPTPYPKELKAHARHARNLALKRRDSFGVEGDDDNSLLPRDSATMFQQPSTISSSSNHQITNNPKASHTEIKEAKLTLAAKNEMDLSINYDSQLHHHSLMNSNQKEQLRTFVLQNQQKQFYQQQHQSDPHSTIGGHESSAVILNKKTIIPTQIEANNTIINHFNIESETNLREPKFPREAYTTNENIQQQRPMTIYNNKPVENLLALSSSSSPLPPFIYQSSQENSPRSNHPSPSSSTSSYAKHSGQQNHHQLNTSLERQALMRTSVVYTAHREQPVLPTQYTMSHDNYGSHLSNYSGTSYKTVNRNQNSSLNPPVNQNLPTSTQNLSDNNKLKQLNNQQYSSSTSHHQIVHNPQKQQQCTRDFTSSDAILNDDHRQQLSKIMLTPITIQTNMKIIPSTNENDQLVVGSVPKISTSSTRYINPPPSQQAIYNQSPVNPVNQLSSNYGGSHIVYQTKHQNLTTQQLNQLDHQQREPPTTKIEPNQSSQPTDNLVNNTS